MDLKIYTQNCYGYPLKNKKARLIAFRKIIKDLDPDIVCLQEIFTKTDINLINPGYEHIGYFKGKITNRGGLVILSKLPGKFSFKKYKEQGEILSRQVSDRLIEKGFMVFNLDNSPIEIVNTHLVSTYTKKNKLNDYQADQLEELIKYIKSKKVVLCGNLNFHKESPYYRILSNYVEDLAYYHDDPTNIRSQRTMDYILLSRLESKRASIKYIDPNQNIFSSKYRGLFAEFEELKIQKK